MACAAAESELDTPQLRAIHADVTRLRALVARHVDALRPDPAPTLWLREPRNGEEHLHWTFDRFRLRSAREISGQAGASKYDHSMAGIRSIDFGSYEMHVSRAGGQLSISAKARSGTTGKSGSGGGGDAGDGGTGDSGTPL
eukprot:5952270-Pleurochrysis_carterae.AAC.3